MLSVTNDDQLSVSHLFNSTRSSFSTNPNLYLSTHPFLFPCALLIRDGGAAWAGEVEDFVAFESCFFAPAPEVGALSQMRRRTRSAY
jgi:hypothetical protein